MRTSIVLSFILLSCAQAKVYYVKSDAPGNQSGTNWANAYHGVSQALDAVAANRALGVDSPSSITEIWVTKGTYYPPDSKYLVVNHIYTLVQRAGAFELNGNIRLLGGFAGTETLSGQANRFANPTVLSGDIKSKQSGSITHSNAYSLRTTNYLSDPNFADNAYNVIRVSGSGNIIDGFVITGGNASGDFTQDMITASTASPGTPVQSLRNEVAGGGLYYSGPSNPTNGDQLIVANCDFVNNQAALGGAVASPLGRLYFLGCTFEKNNATWGGGAIYEQDPVSAVQQCLFLDNQAARDGGAIKYMTFSPIYDGTQEEAVREAVTNDNRAAAQLQKNVVRDYTGTVPPHLAMIVGSTSALPGLIGRTPSAAETANDMNNIVYPYLQMIAPEVSQFVQAPVPLPIPGPDFRLPVYVGQSQAAPGYYRRNQIHLYHFTTDTQVVITTFQGNKAAVGGAVSVQRANVQFDMCNFQTNSATLMAGAIYGHLFDQVKVVSSAFYNNSGGKGASAVLNALNSRTHLLNCTFSENKSDSDTIGYAVASTSGSWIDVANCIFWNNRRNGGTTGADLFTATSATMGGTAIDTLGDFKFDITAFTDLTYSDVQSLQNVPPGNWLVFPACFVTNSYNQNGYASGIALVGDQVDPKCFYWEGGGVQMGEGFHQNVRSGKNNLSVDPILTQNVKLTLGSPMIDAGTARNEIDQKIVHSLLDEDLEGAPRVQGASVDIGAYEGGVAPARFYVNKSATGLNNGLSWANAFTNLDSALTTNNEVWVAEGTYYPSSHHGLGSGPRDYHFRIPPGARVYGGFQSGATQLSDSNPSLHPTILSGDIGVPGDDTDNCYSVVKFSSGFGNAIFDGFTITKGRSMPTDDGAGMYIQDASPYIRSCTFVDNRATRNGGAIATYGYQTIYLVQCTFTNNFAQQWGGAVYGTGFLNFQDCRFESNTGGAGGAIFFEPQSAEIGSTVSSSLFHNNVANTAQTGLYNSGYTYHGGAIHIRGIMDLDGCTFSGNSVLVTSANSVGGAAIEMAVSGRRIGIVNSILWGNRVTNSGSGISSL